MKSAQDNVVNIENIQCQLVVLAAAAAMFPILSSPFPFQGQQEQHQ